MILELANPATNPSPGRAAMGLADIDALVGNMDVAMIDVSDALFSSSIVANTIASPEALHQPRSSFNVMLGYLDEVGRSQVSALDQALMLRGSRDFAGRDLRNHHRRVQ